MLGGKARALLKRKLKRSRTFGVKFHEIIAVTKMGKGTAAQKPETFSSWPAERRDRGRQIYQGYNKRAIV